MAEKYPDPDCSVDSKINTLGDSLTQFGMKCLLEQLDISLDLVRRKKETEEQHLIFLKSVDKNLLKLSLIHHPDRAMKEKKSDREIEISQNLQVALNATRTLLKALTRALLEHTDTHCRYEFFAQMDFTTLINEKEMDRQISNVLCKLSRLSGVKRACIVGEIWKFLRESRKSLRSFQDDDKDEFERHRDYALRYLRKCIEGHEVLATECELILKECRGEHGGSARNAIEKMFDQSLRELNILQNLKRVAEKSLCGTLQVFSVYEHVDKYDVDEYDYYLLSPFIFYINVMLMCTAVVNRKSGFFRKVLQSYSSYLYITDFIPLFNAKPELFSKAYILASHLNNKTQYGREVEIILQRKSLATTDDNIIREFKYAVEEIEQFLEEEFDINNSEEGKTNREQFTKKLSKLNESIAGYKEVKKELQEKLDLCKNQTSEIRKEYLEFSEKFQETEENCLEHILKCKNISEDITYLISEGNQAEINRNRNVNLRATKNECKTESAEIKLIKILEENEKISKNLLNCLRDYTQSITKSMQSGFENLNDCSPLGMEEVEGKIKASYEMNKKISAEMRFLITLISPKLAREIMKEEN